MLLTICDFHENQWSKGHTYLIGLNEIRFMEVPWKNKNILKLKYTLVNSVHSIMQYTISNLGAEIRYTHIEAMLSPITDQDILVLIHP